MRAFLLFLLVTLAAENGVCAKHQKRKRRAATARTGTNAAVGTAGTHHGGGGGGSGSETPYDSALRRNVELVGRHQRDYSHILQKQLGKAGISDGGDASIPEGIRPYTTEGFKVVQTPPALQAMLLNRLRLAEQAADAPMPVEGELDIISKYEGNNSMMSLMAELTLPEKAQLSAGIAPLVSDWASGRRLLPTATHGVRRYLRNATFARHRDHPESHILVRPGVLGMPGVLGCWRGQAEPLLCVLQAAICNVAQDRMDKDWPLVIEDHDGVDHTVVLQPGQSLLYEAARLAHSRLGALPHNLQT